MNTALPQLPQNARELWERGGKFTPFEHEERPFMNVHDIAAELATLPTVTEWKKTPYGEVLELMDGRVLVLVQGEGGGATWTVHSINSVAVHGWTAAEEPAGEEELYKFVLTGRGSSEEEHES